MLFGKNKVLSNITDKLKIRKEKIFAAQWQIKTDEDRKQGKRLEENEVERYISILKCS